MSARASGRFPIWGPRRVLIAGIAVVVVALCVGVTGALAAGVVPDQPLLWAFVPVLAIGAYLMVAAAFNRTTVVVTPEQTTWSTGPLWTGPWGYRGAVATRAITAVDLRRYPIGSGNPPRYPWEVVLLDRDGLPRAVCLVEAPEAVPNARALVEVIAAAGGPSLVVPEPPAA